MHAKRARWILASLAIVLLASIPAVPGALADEIEIVNDRIDAEWIAPDRLVFTRVEDGVERHFQIDPETGRERALRRRPVSPPPQRQAGDGLPRSVDLGGEAYIRLFNKTDATLRMMWIDREGGARLYGEVPARGTFTQHSYVGHSWAVLDEAGRIVWTLVAPPGGGEWMITDLTPALLAPSAEADAPAQAPTFVRDHDLWLIEDDGAQRRLTWDGGPGDAWDSATIPSPDGRFLFATHTEPAQDHPVYLLDVAPDDRIEPVLKTHQYLKPGDRIAHTHPAVIEAATGRQIPVDERLIPNPWSISEARWHPDGRRVRFLYNARGHQTLQLLELDVESGETRVLIDERSPTFIDYNHKYFLHITADGEAAIWMSERSGYNHLERVDLRTGERTPITSGPWVVRGVESLDEAAGEAVIRLMGLDQDQDPYHVHYARLDLATGALTRLTEGDGTHALDFSPDGRFYVDRWSRVDLPPVHELRRSADGGLIATLATADASSLWEDGWTRPARFVAPGRDGQTEIWGVLFLPRGFDPARSYPIVEQIYAGPQDHHAPKTFGWHPRQRAVADEGVVVVQIDGMGTNWRSKEFHDVAWQNLGDAGFPDRIAWIRAAAETRPWMDLERVGIYGGSAGGQNALRALIAHNDFYKVAVADSGCHDNRMDKIWWNELWMGWPLGDHYDEQSNVTQAHRVEGSLMLVAGGMDDNVDPASTLQVVDALVKADKDFELVWLPSAGHGAAETAYGERRRREFLARELGADSSTPRTPAP